MHKSCVSTRACAQKELKLRVRTFRAKSKSLKNCHQRGIESFLVRLRLLYAETWEFPYRIWEVAEERAVLQSQFLNALGFPSLISPQSSSQENRRHGQDSDHFHSIGIHYFSFGALCEDSPSALCLCVRSSQFNNKRRVQRPARTPIRILP